MQTVKYNLKMNGWHNQMKIITQLQQFHDTVQVHITIIGICDNLAATLNLNTRILIPIQPITMHPYDDKKGQDKTFTQFKIPQHQLLQIQDYITP